MLHFFEIAQKCHIFFTVGVCVGGRRGGVNGSFISRDSCKNAYSLFWKSSIGMSLDPTVRV